MAGSELQARERPQCSALSRFTDLGLLALQLMGGLVFATSGCRHLKNPEDRGKSMRMSEGCTVFLRIAAVLTPLAGFGLVLIIRESVKPRP